jgi:hypothetical protein
MLARGWTILRGLRIKIATNELFFISRLHVGVDASLQGCVDVRNALIAGACLVCVTVLVDDAVAARGGSTAAVVVARTVIVRRRSVVVARRSVLATRDLQLIACAVAVNVVQAAAAAIIEIHSQRARTVIVRRSRIVVACRRVCAARDLQHGSAIQSDCATQNFKLVANGADPECQIGLKLFAYETKFSILTDN